MLLSERKDFDKELNALCDKYRLELVSGIYISTPGPGEQFGAFGAIKAGEGQLFSKQESVNLVSRLGKHMWKILDTEGLSLFPKGNPNTSS